MIETSASRKETNLYIPSFKSSNKMKKIYEIGTHIKNSLNRTV